MALKAWDGFDHYGAFADFFTRSGFLQYGPIGAGNNVTFATGRNGIGKCAVLSVGNTGGGLGYLVFAQRVASAFIGFAALPAGDAVYYAFEFWDSPAQTNQCTVLFRSDNFSIQLFRGNAFVGSTLYGGGDNKGFGTLLYTSPNNVWTPDVWQFIEIWPVIDPSTGSIAVNINNVTVATITGANTRETTASEWDVTHWWGGQALPIDDLYYGDTTSDAGPNPNNTPIGDSRVATLFAIGNDSVQWTPLTGANWQEVSEIAMDGDTSYNFSSTVSQEDLLNFAALPADLTLIFGVGITGAYRKDDAGPRTIKQALKSSATEVHGASWSPSDAGYIYFTDLWILDPNTSTTWTPTGVNSLAAGYKVDT